MKSTQTTERPPDLGERAAHDCAECGQPMFWAEAAVENPDLLALEAPGAEATPLGISAYRCGNGHVSKECPLCGSFETSSWADGHPPRYHVICHACGNDSVAQG